jgi:CO/xanthine dehydrogenase FAD-binding subunit
MPLVIEAPLGVAEAVRLLAAEPDRLIVAGGTDLLPALHDGRIQADRLLSLDRLQVLHGAGRMAEGGLFLGAGLTCTELAGLDTVLPALARAAAVIGPPGVRNAATVGGNLVSAAGGDLLPVLVAVQAVVVLESGAGRRETTVEHFLSTVLDTGRPDLRPGELVAGLRIDRMPADTRFARLTVPGRAVLTLALARDAHLPEIRVALCAGGRVPVRAAAAEALIAAELSRLGRNIASETVTAFGSAVGDAARAAATGHIDYVQHAAQICAQRLLARMVGDD